VPELNAIGIAVSDMAEAIGFYQLVGLDVPETPDEDHVDAFLPNGVRFMLDSEEAGERFEGEKAPWDAFWGQRYALLIDPDGVRVNLYAPL
jgi:catechol 2,3-dioxygenase-like lactoylglutathione lyase family enzyme